MSCHVSSDSSASAVINDRNARTEPNRTNIAVPIRSEWSGVEWNGMIAAQFHSIFDQLISQEIKAFYSDQIQCFHSYQTSIV